MSLVYDHDIGSVSFLMAAIQEDLPSFTKDDIPLYGIVMDRSQIGDSGMPRLQGFCNFFDCWERLKESLTRLIGPSRYPNLFGKREPGWNRAPHFAYLVLAFRVVYTKRRLFHQYFTEEFTRDERLGKILKYLDDVALYMRANRKKSSSSSRAKKLQAKDTP